MCKALMKLFRNSVVFPKAKPKWSGYVSFYLIFHFENGYDEVKFGYDKLIDSIKSQLICSFIPYLIRLPTVFTYTLY
jgi:hypothetical protein